MSQDDKWLKCALQLRDNIEPFLLKDPDFFPDYTLHGTQHINRVLKLADQLIACDTLAKNIDPGDSDIEKYGLLKPRDVAFLICGILLHDMGMYLRPDGLKKLVKQDHTDDAFGGKPWNQEWSDYVDRTKRLSQEKMRYHFGKVIPVTEDCVDHADDPDNRRIIGEFLRQHHARLSHEFATGILYGTEDTDLFANTGLKPKDRMMIGLLARSHGMAIRDTEEYLKSKFDDTAKPYKLPVFYLMAVLRLADYLDADGQRAPKQLTQQQKINVPISVEEWAWNQCINADATDFHLHLKNYHVEADPETSRQYVQVDRWLKNVQADLDLCWSILVEKYPCDRYRLSIHRVVSNIHKPDHIKELNNTFLTKEARVTANPEIVKLMMEPLYGNEPTYGVRELLQNAVDACVERSAKEGQGYKGKVTIRVDEESFIIEDNGMGMDENVLLNYYLSAGSSYRNSDKWKQDFMVDGKSQIARTGRFGVGFLAPFLLGNQITVHTQHMNDRKGYVFSFSQDSCPLNIRREKRSEGIGTTIIIQLKKDVYNRLKDNLHWCQWYYFDDPEVQYFMDNQELPCVFDRIPRDPDDPDPWIRLETGKYENYFWLLSSSKTGPGRILPEPDFLCNGIRIEDFPSEIGEFSGWSIQTPKISLLDPHNNLQIDLARKEVLRIPEEDSLVKEIYRYMIAGVLLHAWDLNKTCSVPGKMDVPCLQQGNAFIPCYPVFLAAADVSRYLTVCYLLDPAGERPQHTELIRPDILTADVPVLVHICPKDVHPDDYWPRRDSELKHCLHRIFIPHYLYEQEAMPYPCKEIWIPGEIFIPHNLCTLSFLRREFTPEYPKVIQWNLSQLPDQHELWEIAASKEYGYWERRNKASVLRQKYSQYIMPVDLDRFTADKYGFVMDCIAPDHILAQKSTLFAELLHEYLGDDIWIPFDMAERKKKFPKAFEELAVYMEHIRKYPIE